MCVEGRFFVTPYAVRRYVERVRPGLSTADALRELILITSAGRKTGDYIGTKLPLLYPGIKLEMWRGPRIGPRSQQDRRSRLRFVVGYGPGDKPQIVTVLPVPGCATNVGSRVAATRPEPMASEDWRSPNTIPIDAPASAQEA